MRAPTMRDRCNDYSLPPYVTPGPWSSPKRTRRHTHRSAILEPTKDVQQIFNELMHEWTKDTWFVSSIKKRISHPAYLKIIGLGTAAVPLIIEELRTKPDHWFWALEAITRDDPAPDAQNMNQLQEAWLSWADTHGY